MKTKFLIVFIVTLIAFAASVSAQQYAFVEPSKNTTPYLRWVKENVSEPSYYNNISTRAIRDFAINFPEVSHENWLSIPDLFVAMFTLNDVSYRVDYDSRGNWIETFKTYSEKRLPEDVRQAVKGSYYDYHIYLVQEIVQPFHPALYIVHLDGRKRLINLQIYDGAMQEWQTFKKSK